MSALSGASGPARAWLRVTVHHPPAVSEAVSEVFFSLGAQAVWEDRPDEHGRLVSRAGFAPERAAALKQPLADRLARIAGIFNTEPLRPLFTIEAGADWAEKWKEGLEPIIVRQTLAVQPTWWAGPLAGAPPLVLKLDPGLAFGTGHHATTYMCLWALLDLLQKPVGRLLDLGAGSGILALSAALLTAGQTPRPEIIGLDNDPETVPVAVANAALNGLEDRVAFTADPRMLAGKPCGLILANITLGPLLALKETVAQAAGAGAGLVLSGLLADQVEEATAAYRALGFQPQRLLRLGEWAALVLRQGPAGPPPKVVFLTGIKV